MADKAVQEMERIYTIPLRDVKSSPRNHQADRAVRAIKSYLTKHMKADEVWIDGAVNETIWARGMYTIPSRIRVRARKFDDGVVEVSLPEAEQKGSIREGIKKRREAAAEKKEKKAEEKADEKKESAEESKKESPEKKEGESKPSEKKEAAEKPAAKKAEEKPSAPSKPETGAKKEHHSAGKPEGKA